MRLWKIPCTVGVRRLHDRSKTFTGISMHTRGHTQNEQSHRILLWRDTTLPFTVADGANL